MKTSTLRYVGPHDEVETIDADTGALVICAKGKTCEVSAAAAGRAPKGEPGDEYDPGEGLLAQPDNWRAVRAPKPTPGKKDDDTAKPAKPAAAPTPEV